MTETLSIRIDSATRKRLDLLAEKSNRTKSFLASEAISAYLKTEEWQLGEIEKGIKELDRGEGVSHERVAKWLKTWGTPSQGKAPRGHARQGKAPR